MGLVNSMPALGIACGILIFLGIFSFNYFSSGPPISELDNLLDKWIRVKGDIKKLLLKPALHEKPPEWNEIDIYDYGVERVLIVQNDIIVDFLILNNFHADQRVLIMSANGYPKYIEPQLNQILKSSPSIKIYFAHDEMTKTEGITFTEAVKTRFHLDNHNIIDLGVYKEDAPSIIKVVKVRGKEDKDYIPLDFIPFPLLSSLFILSFEKDVPFITVLQDFAAGGDSGTDYVGGFG